MYPCHHKWWQNNIVVKFQIKETLFLSFCRRFPVMPIPLHPGPLRKLYVDGIINERYATIWLLYYIFIIHNKSYYIPPLYNKERRVFRRFPVMPIPLHPGPLRKLYVDGIINERYATIWLLYYIFIIHNKSYYILNIYLNKQ